jgi:hypothetical protein
MKAKVEGAFKTDHLEYQFNGIGYMEKNGGCKFPKQWLWLQTNHFQTYNASLTLAKADLIGNCSGFFCVLNIDGDEFRFATYNGFTIDYQYYDNIIKLIIQKDGIYLIIAVKWTEGNFIVAPIAKAKMAKEIEESLTSTLTLSLYRGNEMIFHDTAVNVACENLYASDNKDTKKTS